MTLLSPRFSQAFAHGDNNSVVNSAIKAIVAKEDQHANKSGCCQSPEKRPSSEESK